MSYSIFDSKENAEEIAQANMESDKYWKYKVIDLGNGKYYIEVFDDIDRFIGLL